MATPTTATARLQMVCPNLRCRKLLSVPEIARGRMVRCKHCAMRISVPEKNPNPAPAK